MNAADGMNYAPKGKAEAVVKPGGQWYNQKKRNPGEQR